MSARFLKLDPEKLDEGASIDFMRARTYDPSIGRFLQVDPDPGNRSDTSTINNKYVYTGNIPTTRTDPSGRFWWTFIQFLGYTAAASAVQAHFQVHNGGDSGFHKNFWNNLGINLLASVIGIVFSGSSSLKMGFGGLYDSAANSTGRGYSLGFFQNLGGDAYRSATFWHEFGHSVNFFISGLFWRGNFQDRLNSASTFYGVHLFGSLAFPNYNPVTSITEGFGDLWSSPWNHFKELKNYQDWIPK